MPRSRPLRLLIAEDQQRVRSILARGLSEEGFAAVEAADGRSALALAMNGDVDLVLLDWMLPGSWGRGVLGSMRRSQKGTRVVMVPARDEVRARTLALNEGADDYILKPYVFDE